MTKARVLFVDDEERILRMLKLTFRKDYELFTATNGIDALAIVSKHYPHVVVSDQRMPKMTGIALLAKVRDLSPNTVRILLTGYSDLVAIIGAVNEGEVYRFLNKPWNEDELASAIAEAVSIAETHDTLLMTTPDTSKTTYLANATKLLAIDGVDKDRHAVMEMFIDDYSVLGAKDFTEAMAIADSHNVGVVVAAMEGGDDDIELALGRFRQLYPATTIVVVTAIPNSDTLIRLINDAKIYRFAMKPIAPNAFRVAVAAAMREHHRRLALEHHQRYVQPNLDGLVRSTTREPDRRLADCILSSLGRFTKIV